MLVGHYGPAFRAQGRGEDRPALGPFRVSVVADARHLGDGAGARDDNELSRVVRIDIIVSPFGDRRGAVKHRVQRLIALKAAGQPHREHERRTARAP